MLCLRPVLPSVSPGYLRPMIPDTIPQEPESWQDILKDMDRVIMPGVSIILLLLISAVKICTTVIYCKLNSC